MRVFLLTTALVLLTPFSHARERREGKSVENKAVIGIVERSRGVAHCEKQGASQTVVLGQQLHEKDRLKTESSRLHIRYKDGTYIEVGDDSSFEVEKLRFKVGKDPDETNFRFFYGVLRVTAANVRGLQRFVVKTANALMTISDQADFFLVQEVGHRDLKLYVLRGSVDFINIITNEKMTVAPGTSAFLRVTGLVVPAENVTATVAAGLKERTRI